jgi:hypothetical protein
MCDASASLVSFPLDLHFGTPSVLPTMPQERKLHAHELHHDMRVASLAPYFTSRLRPVSEQY